MYGHFAEEVRAMNIELQKANMWKRISAGLFDGILLAMLAVGLAFLLSVVLGYDGHTAQLEARYAEYEARYGITLDITSADYDAMTEEERAQYDAALAAFAEDREAGYLYSLLINLTLVIITFGILLSYLILELIVPLLFGNGQTVGKKVFGIGLVRQDCVRITPFMLFVRTLLGKCTVETMIPAYILILIIFGNLGMTGTVILAGFAVLQLALVATSRTNAAIHDMMAATVAVDLNSQMIFESEADLLAYKNKLHAENAARDKYIS
jgi:uncharacterized RDD family membrane protein YckC